ncbi:MAG: YtxH domain-containing protein [Chloroflexi bacterium]|nr:YtxH domain-containing protein [Chloroflexota bacterium]
MADETTTAEEELVEELSEEHTGAGPGFVLGTVLGILAGAAAATLFAPATGEELRHRFSEESGWHEDGESAPQASGPETPVERVRTLLTRVRSRMKEATAEGREAAHEVEEEQRARFAELTKND